MGKPEGEWFDDWFDETYLAIYQHRDTGEARRFGAWLAGLLPDEGGRGTLDVACGAGRHSFALSGDHGWPVVGLDRSPHLLRVAKKHAGPSPAPRFVRGDMRRLPFAEGRFGLVLSLFTSFGYFDDDAEHALTLAEMARVLDREGALVLDLPNRARTVQNLVPDDRKQVEELDVRQERRYDPERRRVIKTIRITGPEGDLREAVESVRLFSLEELESLLVQAGLRTAHLAGDYTGSPFDPAGSDRMVIVARKHHPGTR